MSENNSQIELTEHFGGRWIEPEFLQVIISIRFEVSLSEHFIWTVKSQLSVTGLLSQVELVINVHASLPVLYTQGHDSLRCCFHFNSSVSHFHPVYILFKGRADSSDTSLASLCLTLLTWMVPEGSNNITPDTLSLRLKPLQAVVLGFFLLHTERNDISSEPSHARCLCAHGAGHGNIFPLFLWDGVGFLQPQAEWCWGGVWDRQTGSGVRFMSVCRRGGHAVDLCEFFGRYSVKTILCQTE